MSHFEKNDSAEHSFHLTETHSSANESDFLFGIDHNRRTKGTVLVVEDYPTNMLVASIMLRNLGYHVIGVSNGEEAVALIASAHQPFVAILMDVQMPEMDGFEATRRIRKLETEKGFRHPIIGVTAHALAGDRKHCLDAGMNDYLSKPIHPDILATKLATIICVPDA